LTDTILTVSEEFAEERTQCTYSPSVDSIDKADWTEILEQFDDATLFQTWEYESVRWAEHRLSHIVLEREGAPVAAAQVRVVQMPLLKCGVAYVYSGPLWRRRGETPNPEIFRAILLALRREYAEKRGLLLRVVPNEIQRKDGLARQALNQTGFHRLGSLKPYRSFLVDLQQEEEAIIGNFTPRCRNKLRRVIKKHLETEVGTSDELFKEFMYVYCLMRQRKQFEERIDVQDFAQVQSQLTEPLKMPIVVCRCDGQPVAAAVCAAVGNTANLLLLATSELALKLNASILAVWHGMLEMKSRGVRYFDFGGVDPEDNPGGYMFKSCFGGEEIFHVGTYEVCDRALSGVVTHGGENLRNIFQKGAWLAKRVLPKRPAAIEAPGDEHDEK